MREGSGEPRAKNLNLASGKPQTGRGTDERRKVGKRKVRREESGSVLREAIVKEKMERYGLVFSTKKNQGGKSIDDGERRGEKQGGAVWSASGPDYRETGDCCLSFGSWREITAERRAILSIPKTKNGRGPSRLGTYKKVQGKREENLDQGRGGSGNAGEVGPWQNRRTSLGG